MPPTAREQRLLLTHGTFDPMIPLPKVREQIGVLKAAGLHIEWHEFVKEHTIAGEAELRVIRDFICAGFQETASTESSRIGRRR
jgi:predicted esterase